MKFATRYTPAYLAGVLINHKRDCGAFGRAPLADEGARMHLLQRGLIEPYRQRFMAKGMGQRKMFMITESGERFIVDHGPPAQP
jgi:hypothetical protein